MRPPRDLAALAEDAEWLARSGVDDREAMSRLGYSRHDSLRAALRRAGAIDVADRLRANRPLLNEDTWVAGPVTHSEVFGHKSRGAA